MAPNAAGRGTRGIAAAASRAAGWTEDDLRRALDRLHDVPFLQTHPLAAAVGAEAGDAVSVGRAVRRRLLEAIDALGAPGRPGALPGRVHRLLVLRYAEGLAPAAVWAQLGLSRTVYYEEQARAIAAVASLLRQRLGPARAPRASDAGAGALPPASNSFVGRDAELAELAGLLEAGRLVTLTGPAGTGKTRLAVEVARRWRDCHRDRVSFAPLAALTGPAHVLPAVARAVGALERARTSVVDAIAAHLREGDTLLVLDNVEHLLDAAPAVGELLGRVPRLRVLATSREPLAIAGEQEYALGPLPAPATPTDLSPAEALAYPAVRLFVDRAGAVDAHFALADADAAAVAELCRRCDGLPLAIELAAARVRTFPPRALLARLGNALDLLSAGGRGAEPRHRTLRAAIDWSYRLLDADDQRLFRGLGVFAGGCRLEAVEAVLGAPEDGGRPAVARLWDGVESLRRKSLLERAVERDGEPRFSLLETLRAYALDALDATGEAAAVRARHAAYFLAIAEDGASPVVGQLFEDAARHERLGREHDNLLAALRVSLASGDGLDGLRMAAVLGSFWVRRVYLDEGKAWLEQALALPVAREAIAARADALAALGHVVRRRADFATARRLFEESLAIWRQRDEAAAAAAVLAHLGNIAYQERRLDDASVLLGEARSLAQAHGDAPAVGVATMVLGQVAFLRRDLPAARTLLEQALDACRQSGSDLAAAYNLDVLGQVALAEGQVDEARARFVACAALTRPSGDRVMTGNVLDGLAAVAQARAEPVRALRLFGAADALREQLSAPRTPALDAFYGPWQSRARVALSEPDAESATAAGRALSAEDALAEALDAS